jgi:hypothetical protein
MPAAPEIDSENEPATAEAPTSTIDVSQGWSIGRRVARRTPVQRTSTAATAPARVPIPTIFGAPGWRDHPLWSKWGYGARPNPALRGKH